MRVRSTALAFGLAVVVSACGSPPATEVDAAKASVDKAESNGAAQYASESLKAAQDARAALDAELKAQDAKTFKSYNKAKELAIAATAAGNKAAAEAVAAREKADAAKAARERAAAVRAAARAKAVHVGGKIQPPMKVKNVAPVYPEIAKSARVTGAVVIEATIDEDGKVVDTKVLHSVPLLDQAALDAVRQWEYTPTQLNGKPVPVVTTVTINFTKP
jgi:TonB family protein